MPNTDKDTNKKEPITFGEEYFKYLNIIAEVEVILSLVIAGIVLSKIGNVSSALDNSDQIKTIYIISAIAIFITGIIIYIILMAIKNILNNSIENRKILIQLRNIQEKTQK